jgi:DNA-binding Lrp family transcriptional regulator
VQRPRHVRQRDHHDRHVEQQHERAQTHRRQRPPCTSRASFSRLGTVLGASDQTVARRYRRLTAEAGLRVVAIRDAERLGQDQDQWMLRLRCAPDNAPNIADALAGRPDTAWIGLASGGTEIICLTRPRNPGDHDDLLLGRLPRATGRPESAVERRLAALIGSGAVYIDIEYDSELFGSARAAVLYAYLSGPLGQLDGVRHVEASAFLGRVKQLTYRTLPLNSPSTRAPSK